MEANHGDNEVDNVVIERANGFRAPNRECLPARVFVGAVLTSGWYCTAPVRVRSILTVRFVKGELLGLQVDAVTGMVIAVRVADRVAIDQTGVG